jgi:uncharacterized phiE125 gp8 family phage protein
MPSILLTAPAGEPISLAEAKAFLRVEHNDDDATIGALMSGARIHIEAQTRRALMTQTWRLTRDVWPASGVLPLLPAQLRALVAVRVYDADSNVQTVLPASFGIDKIAAPAVLTFERGALPAPGRIAGGIEIDIEAGYGAAADVPEPLRHAIRLLVAHWYENRALISASGEIASVPASVASLIAPYRVVSL